MRVNFSSFNLFLAASLSMTLGEVWAATPGPPPFAAKYQLVFNQDFTTMTSLSQLGVSASTMGTGTWIAHTPNNQDYFTFENPTANYKPFGVGDGALTIRVQQDGNDPNNWFGGFSGGLLSSMDSSGVGFAQKYGYFECSAWTPGTPNTWPAFWLLSAPNMTNQGLPFLAEIDVMEAYGNYQSGPSQTPPGNPNAYSVAWHNWGKNGNATTQSGLFLQEAGLTEGYHTYGVDVEPTGISWYFDRQLVWQAPIFAAAQQPLLAMVNLALGGGNYNNPGGTGYNWGLTPNPADMKVQYVAVWASPFSPNYVPSGIPAAPTGLTATGGNAQVALVWNASSNATNYTVLRGTSPGTETVLATNVLEASYTDSTVTNGKTYYYQVTATNSLGSSGASSETSGASTGGAVSVAIPGPPSFGSNYELVFGQDFTTMSNLSQLGVSASTMGSGTWIAHTPTNEDYFTFENPTANYQPFGVGNGYLDIRVQQDGNDPNNWFSGYSGGLLSSMDSNGAGFAQKYGYFECSMWTPGGPNTWPAFWLLSAPNMTNANLPYLAEIDVMESYGNYQTGANQTPPGNPNAYSVAWHNWGANGNPTSVDGIFFNETGLTSGFHQYGVDVEPTGITWYFDRQLVWQAPIFAAAQQPLLVMVDLALGGGDYNNSNATGYNWVLTSDPTDLKVQYVAVWASPNSPNYTGSGTPGAPTGLTATGGNGQVALTWNATAGATSYKVMRGMSSGGEGALTSGVTATSYLDSAVTAGNTYYYEVMAVNGSGSSAASNEANGTPIAAVTIPAAPTNLSATGGNAQIKLAWTASSSAKSYSLLRGTSSGSETLLIAGLTATAYTDTTVSNGTTYYYEVVAVNGAGTSVASNEANGTPTVTVTIPATPMGLSATGGTAQIKLAWSSSAGATTYTVMRGTASGAETILISGVASTSYTDTSVTNGAIYYYEVAAVNAAGTSGDSNEVNATGIASVTVPPTPTGLSATGGNTQITLSWNSSSGATSYNVLRSMSSSSETSIATAVTSTSYTDTTVVNGTTYYYEVAAVNSAGTSGASSEIKATPAAGTVGPLPSPWLNQDIGITWATGSSSYFEGTFALSGAGDAYYLPDRFQFAYQTISGDGSIVARVITEANSNRHAKAGVMIRDGLANNSGFADMILMPNNGGSAFQYRADGGGPNGVSGQGSAPYWVKITRAGNTFTGLVSTDGITWTTVGSATFTMPATIYIGLIQASGVDGLPSTSTFDNVTVTSESGSGVPSAPAGLSVTEGGGQVNLTWSASAGAVSYNVLRGTSSGGEKNIAVGITSTGYTDSTVAAGTTYYYEVEAVSGSGVSGPSNEAEVTAATAGGALPSAWLNQDVGETRAAGSSSYSGGTFTLEGAGGGAYYTPDGFQFAYRAISGDCTIIARVVTQANSNIYAHAGVIIRDSLSDTGGFAAVTLYPDGGGALFQYRADTGYPSTLGGAGTAPYWVKLTRSGNIFTGSVSPDGTNWTKLGSTTVTLPAEAYVGLLQASGINGTLATSTFDNVEISGTATAP